MKKINFFEKKYYSLESFYGWVDQGSDYDLAIDQTLYYDHFTDKMEEIIENITIATRFARSGKELPKDFKESLKTIVAEAKAINLDEYEFSDKEKKVFKEDLEEIEALIM